jgi:hypothetical protein
MTRRLLPPSDWPRLAGTELGEVWQMLPTDRAVVLVVEDGDGAIVGTWAFLWVLHAEGVWIDQAHRKGSAVARHLLRGLHDVADSQQARAIWTGSIDPAIDALVQRHLGAQEVPCKSWIIPMVKGES